MTATRAVGDTAKQVWATHNASPPTKRPAGRAKSVLSLQYQRFRAESAKSGEDFAAPAPTLSIGFGRVRRTRRGGVAHRIHIVSYCVIRAPFPGASRENRT
jgi:hypothetical protein